MNNKTKFTKNIIVYIVGTGRSGSTLLDRTLGQLPGVVSVGELDFISEINLDDQLCGCGEKFSKCELWSQVEYEGRKGLKQFPLEKIDALRLKLERNIHLPKLLFNGQSAFYHDLAEYESQLWGLYRSISAASGCHIIVDSSKDIRRLLILNRMKAIDLVVIHLVRDPRAVAYSWTKSYLRPEITNQKTYMHRYNPMRTSWRWLYKNFLLSVSRRMFSKYIKINYDAFVTHPKTALASILPLMGLESEKLDFIEEDELYLQKKTHTVSGNPMRFSEGTITFRYDDAWKRKMSIHQKLAVTAISWPLELIYLINRLITPTKVASNE